MLYSYVLLSNILGSVKSIANPGMILVQIRTGKVGLSSHGHIPAPRARVLRCSRFIPGSSGAARGQAIANFVGLAIDANKRDSSSHPQPLNPCTGSSTYRIDCVSVGSMRLSVSLSMTIHRPEAQSPTDLINYVPTV